MSIQLCHPAWTLSWTSKPSIALEVLHQVFKLDLKSTSTTSTPCTFTFLTVSFSFSHTHVLCFAFTDFHSSSFQYIPPPAPYSHRSQCHVHTSESTETPAWPHLSACPSPLQTRRSSAQVADVIPTLNSVTPTCTLTTISISSYMPQLHNAIPQFHSWHPIVCFLLIYKAQWNSSWPSA